MNPTGKAAHLQLCQFCSEFELQTLSCPVSIVLIYFTLYSVAVQNTIWNPVFKKWFKSLDLGLPLENMMLIYFWIALDDVSYWQWLHPFALWYMNPQLYKHFYKGFLFPVSLLYALKQLFTKVNSLWEFRSSYQWDFLLPNLRPDMLIKISLKVTVSCLQSWHNSQPSQENYYHVFLL